LGAELHRKRRILTGAVAVTPKNGLRFGRVNDMNATFRPVRAQSQLITGNSRLSINFTNGATRRMRIKIS